MHAISQMAFILLKPIMKYKVKQKMDHTNINERTLQYVKNGLMLTASTYQQNVIQKAENILIDILQKNIKIAKFKHCMKEHYRYVTMVQKFWKQYTIKVKNYKIMFQKEWFKYFSIVFDSVVDIHIHDAVLKQQMIQRYQLKDTILWATDRFFQIQLEKYRDGMSNYLKMIRDVSQQKQLSIQALQAFLSMGEDDQQHQYMLLQEQKEWDIKGDRSPMARGGHFKQRDIREDEIQQAIKLFLQNQQNYEENLKRNSIDEMKKAVTRPKLFHKISIEDIKQMIREVSYYLDKVFPKTAQFVIVRHN